MLRECDIGWGNFDNDIQNTEQEGDSFDADDRSSNQCGFCDKYLPDCNCQVLRLRKHKQDLVKLEVQKRPDTRPKCVATMISTQSGQSAAVWTKSVPWGPSEDLCDPKKGHFGPKRALLVSLGAQKRPDTRPKCVVTMIPTQSDQLAAVGTKSGPSGVLRSFSPS